MATLNIDVISDEEAMTRADNSVGKLDEERQPPEPPWLGTPLTGVGDDSSAWGSP